MDLIGAKSITHITGILNINSQLQHVYQMRASLDSNDILLTLIKALEKPKDLN